MTEDRRTVPEFHGVQLGGAIDAELRVETAQRVSVIADEDVAPLVRTWVNGGILHVETSGSSRQTRGVRLVISAPRLDSVEATEDAVVHANLRSARSFRLDASGHARLEIRGIEADALTVMLHDSAEAKLSGHAKSANVKVASSDASFTADHLDIDHATLEGPMLPWLPVPVALEASKTGGARVMLGGAKVLDVPADVFSDAN